MQELVDGTHTRSLFALAACDTDRQRWGMAESDPEWVPQPERKRAMPDGGRKRNTRHVKPSGTWGSVGIRFKNAGLGTNMSNMTVDEHDMVSEEDFFGGNGDELFGAEIDSTTRPYPNSNDKKPAVAVDVVKEILDVTGDRVDDQSNGHSQVSVQLLRVQHALNYAQQTTKLWELGRTREHHEKADLLGRVKQLEIAYDEEHRVRIEAEAALDESETTAHNAQSARNYAEAGRVAAEARLTTVETMLATVEAGRVAAEAARVTAEEALVASRLDAFRTRVCVVCTPDDLGDQDYEDEDMLVARCRGYHGVCQECLDGAVTAATHDTTGNALTCCVPGCIFTLEQSQVAKSSPGVYANYVRARAEEEGAMRAREQTAREAAVLHQDEAGADMRQIKDRGVLVTPCCGSLLTDFTDCCSISCNNCPRRFCAWCFEVFPPGEDGHGHIHDNCPINPDSGLYADTPRKEKILTHIWRSYQLSRLAPLLEITPADPKPRRGGD